MDSGDYHDVFHPYDDVKTWIDNFYKGGSWKFLGLIFLFFMVFYAHEFVEYEKKLMNSEYFFSIPFYYRTRIFDYNYIKHTRIYTHSKNYGYFFYLVTPYGGNGL